MAASSSSSGPSPNGRRVLVSGATGYIGGRLVPCLLRSGYTVRCFVRDASRLQGYPWENDVEIAEGDALDYSTLPAVLDGVDAAYYLIHSLGAGEDEFEDLDRKAANNFGRAAQEAGVERIIYLGGIQPKGDAESDHLKSRLETGDYLRRWDVPVTELRAAVVVGSGSLSFELIRYLTERVPVMVCPTWVQTPTQPIAIRNVLQYLKAALETPESAGEIVEIGGTDVLTYGDMFKIYAEVRGLNRPIINVPVLTPRLSSHWVGLVTPVSNQIARPLIEGLDNEVTVDNPERARTLFPDVEPISYEAAVRLALRRTSSGDIPTVWNSALSSTPTAQSSTRPSTSTLDLTEGMFRETRQITVDAAPETAFDVVTRIGGANGWLYARPLWRLRGLVDQWIGGVGFRQGRRDPDDLRVGDTVDFWRVEALTDPRRDADADTFLLRLRAEMKMPGRAWLQYEVIPPEAQAAEASTNGQPAETCIAQTLFFEPKGLLGTLYWYAAQPVDRLIYSGMLRTLERRIRDAAPAHSAASERSPEPVA